VSQRRSEASSTHRHRTPKDPRHPAGALIFHAQNAFPVEAKGAWRGATLAVSLDRHCHPDVLIAGVFAPEGTRPVRYGNPRTIIVPQSNTRIAAHRAAPTSAGSAKRALADALESPSIPTERGARRYASDNGHRRRTAVPRHKLCVRMKRACPIPCKCKQQDKTRPGARPRPWRGFKRG